MHAVELHAPFYSMTCAHANTCQLLKHIHTHIYTHTYIHLQAFKPHTTMKLFTRLPLLMIAAAGLVQTTSANKETVSKQHRGLAGSAIISAGVAPGDSVYSGDVFSPWGREVTAVYGQVKSKLLCDWGHKGLRDESRRMQCIITRKAPPSSQYPIP